MSTSETVIAVAIIIAIVLILLLACSPVLEAIDRWGCRVDCQGCEFVRYEFGPHQCFCSCNGQTVRIY